MNRDRWLLVGDASSVHVGRLCAALVEAGIDTHVATFKGDPPEGVSFHRLPLGGLGKARYLGAAPALHRLLRQLRPEVVNAHYLSSYGLLAAIATHGPTLVQTTWGTDVLVTARRPGRRWLAQFALKRADLATGDSESLLDEIGRLVPGLERHRFVFGPPRSAFHADDDRARTLVVSARGHEPLYNIDVVLEAWRLAADELVGHELVVLGTGSLTERLRRVDLPRTRFLGQLPHSELLAILAIADVVVSIPVHDATSATVLEALASGCAVVATDLEANREWLPSELLVALPPRAAAVATAIVASAGRRLELDRRWALEDQVQTLLVEVGRVPLRRGR